MSGKKKNNKPKKVLKPSDASKPKKPKKVVKKTKRKPKKINKIPKVKKPYKGVRYIEQVLKKHYKRYATDKVKRKSVAHEIHKELLSKKLSVSIKHIKQIHAALYGKVEEIPVPPHILDNPIPYYECDTTVLPEIEKLNPKIIVVSSILPSGMSLDGGIRHSYYDTFSNFVTYVDSIRKDLPTDDSHGLFVMFTDGYGSDVRRRYLELIVCDNNGNLVEIDFDPGVNYRRGETPEPKVPKAPKTPATGGKEKEIKPEAPTPEVPAPPTPTAPVDIIKEAEARVINKKGELDLLIAKQNALIEVKKSYMDDVKMWKEFGAGFESELKEAIAKLKSVISQIDDYNTEIKNFK